MAGEGPFFQSDDEKYGALLGNLLNPPHEQPAQPTSGAEPQAPASAAAQAIRAGAQAAGQAIQTPPPAQPKQVATPNAVTPSGNGPAAGGASKSWATDGYQRFSQAQQGALDAAQLAAKSTAALQNTPGPSAQNATLEQRRQALAAPIPYRDAQTGKVLTSAVDPETGQTIDPSKLYKPGIGTRIVRGIDAVRRGGVLGAFDPKDVGGTAYGDPNRNYQQAEQIRQQQAGAIQQQEDRNVSNYKAESDRQKDIGSEARGVGTAFGNVAKDEVAEQTANQKADYNQQLEQIKQQLADQAGDKLPTNDTALAMKFTMEQDPAKKKLYGQAIRVRQQMKDDSAGAAADRADARLDKRTSIAQDKETRVAIDAAARAKDKAVTKAQDALNKAPNDPDAIKAAQTDMQAAQDAYEDELTRRGQKVEPLTVDENLVWRKKDGSAVGHNANPPQPAASPAAAPAAKPSAQVAPSGKVVSLAQARELPFNKGKTDAQITADIKAHGHTVAP